MADNTRGGSNDTGLPNIASDDIAGVQYQRVKPAWGVDGSAVDASATNPLPVVQTGTPALPTGAASSANQTTELTDLGAVTEAPPASDTASSGLNGRLQRIAQRITSLIALLPTSLGQKTKAGSLAVTLASDSDALAISGSVTASGTLDVSSVIPGVAATSLGKAEDAAHTTGDTGVMALAVRNDAGTVLAGATGDYIPLSADSAGAVRVNVASGTLTAVTSITNAVHVDDNAGSLTVDGTVAVSGVTPGTAATNLGKVEDAAHASGDVGVMALAVRNDAGTVLAGATGDYIPITTDSTGAVRVTGGGGGTQYTEDVAAAGAESLTLAGTVRQDTPASSNADGDYANLKTDSVGRIWANASGPEVGIVTETAPASDTASSGLNGRLQRIAQRLTSIIALLPASVGQKTKAGSLPVTLASDEDALAISGSVTASGTVGLDAGTNNIGDVDVLTVPADPFGANADAVVAAGAAGSIQAKLRRLTTDIDAIKTSVAGATPAGTNNIGDVDVLTVPADPFGASADAVVAAGAAGSQSAKLRRLTTDLDAIKTSVAGATPAGTNNIGDVDVLTLPALPAGTNNIGDVDVLTLPALPAGTNAIGKLAANTGVDIGDVDVTSIVPGTGATNLGKVEDAAHTTGDVGVMALAVRNDAGTVLAGTTLDYVPLTTDATGALRTTGAGASSAAGDVAHDAADSGNPVKIGGVANNAGPVAVQVGDRVDAWFGLNGEQVVTIASGAMTAADGALNTNELALLNPGGTVTAGMVPVHDYVFNGSTWDRARGDAANGADVDVTRLPALVAGTANIGDVDVASVIGTGTNAAGQVTISSTSATVIASRAGRRGVMLINYQGVPVYLDPSGGTAATTHMRLDPGAAVVLPVTSAITAITAAAYSAAGDAKVHYAELY